MQPHISIIVPIYNTEQYLKDCIDSLLNQTYLHFDIILVNDGSTDNSLNICTEYSTRFPSLIKIINQPNSGVAHARNQGIELAKNSDYICFADSDDIVSPEYLEILAKYLGDHDLSVCSIKKFTVPSEIQHEHDNSTKQVDIFDNLFHNRAFYKLLQTGVLHSPCLKLFRNDILRKNHIRFRDIPICEDFDFNLQYLEHCKSIIFINQALYFYRKTPGSLTTKSSESMFDAYMDIHRRLLDNTEKEFEKDIDTLIYRQYEAISIKFAKSHKFKALKEYLKEELIQKACANFEPTSPFEQLLHLSMRSKSPILLYMTVKLGELTHH